MPNQAIFYQPTDISIIAHFFAYLPHSLLRTLHHDTINRMKEPCLAHIVDKKLRTIVSNKKKISLCLYHIWDVP